MVVSVHPLADEWTDEYSLFVIEHDLATYSRPLRHFLSDCRESRVRPVLLTGPGVVVSPQLFTAMAESGAPDWDVVDVTINTLFTGTHDGLLEKIDTSVVDTNRIAPQFVHEYGIGCIAWSYNLAYNTKTFPAGRRPTTWADLFDTRKFPGKRTMLDQPTANLEAALMADGVAPSDLYPLDVERALRKIDTIKSA